MSRQTDADALIAALAEEARRSAGQKPGPEPEELLDYLEGRLSAEDEERVSRQLAADPEAARALLDLAGFEAAGAVAGTQPPELAARAGWRDLKDKLPGTTARQPRRLPPVLSAIAASLLVTTLGLGSWVLRQQSELNRPIANVASLELLVSRAGVEKVAKAGEPLRLVIRPAERCPPYAAEVAAPRSSDTIDLPPPDERGNLTLLLLRPEPGTYRLRLYGCEPRRQLEEHRFRVMADEG